MKIQKHDSPFFRFLLNIGAWIAVTFSRIKLSVIGREKIDELVEHKQRFLLVGNHLSNYDPIVVWYAFPKAQLAFISKPSNLKIPIFGTIALKCLCLPINREDARLALPTIRQAADYVKAGECSFGAYPEGTRNKTPEEGMLPFHNGVFKISSWSGNCPIVVVSVKGTEKVYKNAPWRRTKVELNVLRVFQPEELAGKRTNEIGEMVREELESAVKSE